MSIYILSSGSMWDEFVFDEVNWSIPLVGLMGKPSWVSDHILLTGKWRSHFGVQVISFMLQYYSKRENSQKRTNIVGFHLYEVPRIVKVIGTDNTIVVSRGWAGKMAESWFSKLRVSVWDGEKFWRWMVMVSHSVNVLVPPNHSLKNG